MKKFGFKFIKKDTVIPLLKRDSPEWHVIKAIFVEK
jgi:hypothetical protein